MDSDDLMFTLIMTIFIVSLAAVLIVALAGRAGVLDKETQVEFHYCHVASVSQAYACNASEHIIDPDNDCLRLIISDGEVVGTALCDRQ